MKFDHVRSESETVNVRDLHKAFICRHANLGKD